MQRLEDKAQNKRKQNTKERKETQQCANIINDRQLVKNPGGVTKREERQNEQLWQLWSMSFEFLSIKKKGSVWLGHWLGLPVTWYSHVTCARHFRSSWRRLFSTEWELGPNWALSTTRTGTWSRCSCVSDASSTSWKDPQWKQNLLAPPTGSTLVLVSF